MVTPLLKQTVYEGIADENYGIVGGVIKIPSSKIDEGADKQKRVESAYKQMKISC